MKVSVPTRLSNLVPWVRALSGASDLTSLIVIARSSWKSFLVAFLTAGCFVATSLLVPTTGSAQVDPRVAKSMETSKALTAKLRAPKVEGKEPVGGKDAPGLNFRTTKISNNF